ncbi:class I SAM-dependent methyltransferase [Alteromonas sediminis]|uniref:class I SAM-dependent methyltransferase n=1 Tax=Alteromonas sediminis TaxID=2259342 RepID=UPI001F0B727D|nr:class I SAM-dependent methyltransferase [Alteromonas sediminis]
MVYVSRECLPTLLEEKREYDLHENSFDDEGYHRFLSRAYDVAATETENFIYVKNALDFGCGPAPVLAATLSRNIAEVSFFDPLYFPCLPDKRQQFDLITCTEAIEHFHTPHEEWHWIVSRLSENGVFIVMTKRVISASRFAQWHYKNDLTHVSFFSDFTFTYLAAKSALTVSFPSDDIAVFKRI